VIRMWGTDLVLTLGGVACFAVAAVMAVAALVRPTRFAERWSLILPAVGVIPLLAELLLRFMDTGRVRALTRFEAFTVYAIFITVVYIGTCLRRRRRAGLSAIVIPYVAMVLILGLPGVREQTLLEPKVQNIWLKLHISAAFLSYALFSVAGVLSVAYLVQDRSLKRKRFSPLLEKLPPLETLDRMMSLQVGAAFALLTVSILLGVLLVRLTGGGEEWVTDPKVTATVATWGVFAILMHMRTSADRHGRRVALVTIMGVLCLLFAFIGVHVVGDSVHDYLKVRGSENVQ
jgi:ABC-type transport system involved in cytochrome c biogenesis permease subunit